MLYELLYPLRHHIGGLNVLRYVPFRAVAATLTAMLMSFLMSPWFIRELQKKQIGQVVREDEAAHHQVKRGTPTMGGALVLLCLLVPTVLWADPKSVFVWSTAAVTAGYGVIGYLDDFLKIRHKSSEGLPARYKLVGQFLVGGAALGYVFLGHKGLPQDWLAIRHHLAVPFLAFSKHTFALPAGVYFAFALIVVVGMSNGVNLTDGADGLAIGPVIINAVTYLVIAYLTGTVVSGMVLAKHLNIAPEIAKAIARPDVYFSVARYLDIPSISAASELTIYCGAMVGAGIGFLWFNAFPASVFMGDVGALALGGGIGMLAVLTKSELLSLILGGIFVVEAGSSFVQTMWFKATRRFTGTPRRLFLRAPFHHHLEAKGWPETKIVVRFWIITILLALVSVAQLKVR
ncbi:MAG: phospho-N-acetylmuramoyl-pentapeptide-transferase [Myxococcales bacterium]|nr:phospho-N-acetylmuramoyl-pentapeptide-transferase [Myxococcales bacterium]MBL8716047.1 phospho-N-acetylmuramoyl-pentapeptide-transferase [Myxococcales bacterium]